ncbi:hypothetical protein [Conexibacter sp. S30A1]|uniref:hypothetical protein n=1 Tax=Conexibacter sp. S30A1 TaxID=2937800 RepID=UPI00200DAB48|nr:hypothetical protein [Conexibacter sp. S30A1]
MDAEEFVLLSDDRVGRALDQLFDCDRVSLLAELVLVAIGEFQIDCSQLHNDSTLITRYGEYAQADGREGGGRSTVAAARGHAQDHRELLSNIMSVDARPVIP